MERFSRSVQHDSSVQVHPRSDPDFYEFLVGALQAAGSLGVEPATAAAATAYLCVSEPRALQLSDAEAGAKLDQLAGTGAVHCGGRPRADGARSELVLYGWRGLPPEVGKAAYGRLQPHISAVHCAHVPTARAEKLREAG